MSRYRSVLAWSAAGSGLVTLLANLAVESSLIFLPLFAQDLGASKFQIGIIGATYGITYFTSSWIFGRLSDLKGRLVFVRIGLGSSMLTLALQTLATNAVAFMLVRSLVGLCLGVSAAALIAYNFEAGGNTGRFASLGSLGWLLGTIVAMFVSSYNILFLVSAASCGLAFIISIFLKEPEKRFSVRPDIKQVTRRNLRIYLSFLLRQLGANIVWVVLPLFMVSLGASKTWIAILSAINTGGQVVAMMLVGRFGASRLFTFGFVLSAAVFLGYAASTNYLQLIPSQVLLALAWSCLYVGALMLLLKKNEERATATGILFSAISISGTVGPFLGGLAAQLWGYPPLMYIAAGFSLAGLVVAVMPER